jgi:hypothetical protein
VREPGPRAEVGEWWVILANPGGSIGRETSPMIALQVLLLAIPWTAPASSEASSPARFGFAEPSREPGKGTEFRLEMELSAAASSYPDTDEELYATLKSIYAAHSGEGSEGSLTDSEFASLASEKVGDVYTLVAGDAVLTGRVTGGTIRPDPQFSDLYRLYLRIGISEPYAPLPEGRVEMIGLKGERAVSAVRSFVLSADPESGRSLFRGLERYGVKRGAFEMLLFRGDPDRVVVAKVPGAAMTPGQRPTAGLDDNKRPRFQSGAYLAWGDGFSPLVSVRKVPENDLTLPSGFQPMHEFEVDGATFLELDEYGDACCEGGPFLEHHLFKIDRTNRSAAEIGHSRAYPLCDGLFV